MEIRIEGLIKHYHQKEVLNIPTLNIKSDTILGIIGPNGAGKSTLAKILAGVDAISSGLITYDGNTFNTDILQQITMVFQKPYLFRTSVFNNIAYPLKIRKINKEAIHNEVNKVIEEMEISDISRQNAWTLSGGEAQKVALARALIFKPRLLLLDEPTANIDPSSIVTMERMISKAHSENNTTIIIVTHNIQQAKRLCTDVLFMNKGEAVEISDTSSILKNPANPITKQFLEGELVF